MNPAKSGRLRTCYLLLLAPLLVASTPSPLTITNGLVLAQSTPPGRLVFLNLPREIAVNQCVPIKLGIRDDQDQPVMPTAPVQVMLGATLLLSSFHKDNTCNSPTSSVSFPVDVPEVTVWYKSTVLGGLTLSASDGAGGLINATSGLIPVVISLTNRLEFTSAPTNVQADAPFDVTVTAFNLLGKAQGYSGTIRLYSEPPVLGLSRLYTFNPPVDSGEKSFTVMLPAGGPYVLVAQDINNSSLQARSRSITVQAAPGTPKVSVFARTSQAATCAPVTLDLTVVDVNGNPEPGGAARVSLCRSRDSATLIDRTFGTVTSDGDCVEGTFTEKATVVWTSSLGEDVSFTISLASSNGPATVSWRPKISPENSSFSFPGRLDPVPQLSPGSDKLTVQLNLSDTCPQPLVLPQASSLTFGADAPLSLGSIQEDPGQWTVEARLSECPAELTRPLAIWPMIDGKPLSKPDGGRVERLIQPRCETAVELSVHSSMVDQAVKAGEVVEFEVELTNKGQVTIQGGVLVLTAEGMTAIEASIDGVPLPPQGEGFLLPELHPGMTLKVKVKAVATAQLDQPVQAKVQYEAPDGTPLTDEKLVSFKREGLGVDVGCGCHSTDVPGQLLPWLVLLLAASRPSERLRRLRRAERTDRQSPW